LVKKNVDGRQFAVKMFLKDAVSKQKKGKVEASYFYLYNLGLSAE
jgi:hypothetical protein